MKQVLQNLKTGEIELAEIPCPRVRPGHLLVQTRASLISAGSERMLIEFGRAGLIAKARSQPEKVRKVLDKIKSDGLLPTLEVVFSQLDEPMPLGYCNTGTVIEVGADVRGFRIGDRVASNGRHAEVVCVPSTLAARVPQQVDDLAASFSVIGSIALQGIRLLEPTFGECFVVTGLGLVGMVAIQLLRANGCNVFGIDPNPSRCELARSIGCEVLCLANGTDPVVAARGFSRDRGVDGVLVTAATKSNKPMQQAARMCRKRGRIVSTGAVGLELERGPLYENELSVQVSCSYGPGRYDADYEQRVHDYPLPYVRWTVARNLEAILDGLAKGRLDIAPLISHRFPLADVRQAYSSVLNSPDSLGVVLTYPEQEPPINRVVRIKGAAPAPALADRVVAGVVGAGNFTKLILLPALKSTPAHLAAVASAGGVTAVHAGRRFGAEETATDYRKLLDRSDINVVFITTQHDTHARIAIESLEAGKHVFLEKPIAINDEQLDQVRRAVAAHPNLHLMVGFNRRFAPHAVQVKELLRSRTQPVAVKALINAGEIPRDHWTQDPATGGGRIIGEACHFVDLLMYLIGHPVTSVQAAMIGGDTHGVTSDKMTITMTYQDGSIGTIHYWANGPKTYPKEQVTVFSEGRMLVIDNWRRLRAYSWPGVPKMRMRQDKGHRAEIAQFVTRVQRGGEPLIPFEEIDLVTFVCFEAMRAAGEVRPLMSGGAREAATNVSLSAPAHA